MEKKTRVIENKRRKKKKSTGRIAVVSIILFLGLVLSVQMVRLYQKNRQYKAQEETLQEELEAQQSRQEDLIEYEGYTQSQQYVEDTAKSKLGMAYSDEIIFREKD